MTTSRPYRMALPSSTAFAELNAAVSRGWCRADLVEAFAASRTVARSASTM